MQQIYKRTPMPKCDFNKATPFPKNPSEWLLLKDEKPRQNNYQAIQMGAFKVRDSKTYNSVFTLHTIIINGKEINEPQTISNVLYVFYQTYFKVARVVN